MDFKSLYTQHWKSLVKFLSSHKDLSNPLLLDFPEDYKNQAAKLFIVGQQTHSWCNEIQLSEKLKTIDDLMDKYKNGFQLGIHYNSPFWNAVRRLEKLFKISVGQALWSNLNRVDHNKGRPSFQIEEALFKVFPVLGSEIQIAKPNVVVFFTGPYFDNAIESNFPGVAFEEINSMGNKLVRVIHRELPYNSFRTYHPSYMRRRKIEQLILEMIKDNAKL